MRIPIYSILKDHVTLISALLPLQNLHGIFMCHTLGYHRIRAKYKSFTALLLIKFWLIFEILEM